MCEVDLYTVIEWSDLGGLTWVGWLGGVGSVE